jgi:class 3 adenylate cyclase
MIEWGGLRTFVAPGSSLGDRFLAALLFTDIVDSTARLSAIGDGAWHELLGEHYQLARAQLERFAGREVDTTGDGMLATFDAPARAIRCADAIRSAARNQGLEIRAGVHVGELSVTEDGVRGVAVHVAARITSAAGPGEILVSDVARNLASSSDLAFGDGSTPVLKGVEDPPTLYPYVARR